MTSASRDRSGNPNSYRPEIDGLRCIAVMAVIFYHASFTPFSGGYIGVDVFFVISGFLITTIINNQMSEGRFGFGHFYERRIRRIQGCSVLIT
ncbi:MAG: acyltransferase [Novosphingobium sp.]|nr:acyltransferase [Novosphingobium sp.]